MGVHVNDHDQLMMETLRDTPFVAPLQREAREQGRTEGRTEGRSEGRSGFLDELLRSRFGDHPAVAEVAQRLSAWPAAQALAAVENADTIEAVPATPEINLRDGAPA